MNSSTFGSSGRHYYLPKVTFQYIEYIGDIVKFKVPKEENKEIKKLVNWMTSNNISGCLLDISKLWSDVQDVKHDYNFYRKMSHLLNITELKGKITSEWVDSKRPIPKKYFRVSPKPVEEKHEADTNKETRLMLGYQLSPDISFKLMGSVIQENGMNMRDESPYLGLY